MAKTFHALDRNASESSGEIFDVLTGVGGLTEARTSVIYQRDWEDIWRSYGSGEPAWFAGRKVENLLPNSQNISLWTLANVTVETNSTLAPDGTLTADKIVADATNTVHEATEQFTNLPFAEHIGAAHLKAAEYTSAHVEIIGMIPDLQAAVDIDLIDGSLSNQVGTITPGVEILPDGWFRVFVGDIADGDVGIPSFKVYLQSGKAPFLGDGISGIYVWGNQVENVTGQADQTPSEYVPTTTAAAHKIFGTDRAGVALVSPPWLYGGPAGTNEITFSRDLTNAAWVPTGTAVAALDAIGLEGVANTASTLTDDDGAAFESVSDSTIIVNDSNTHVARLFLGKDSDETRFPGLVLSLTGGAFVKIGLDINTKTGASAVRLSTGTTASEVNDVGLLWEVLISVVNNTTGNIEAITTIFPAVGTVIGTAAIAATGSAIVGNVELHLNKTIEQVRGSTPIFTAGSTVTVNASDLSFADVNHSDTEGAYFCEFKNVGLSPDDLGGLVGLGDNGRPLFVNPPATSFSSYDGTTVPIGPAVILAADDAEFKVGLAYGSSNFKINIDGVWGGAAAYDGVFNNTNGKLDILHNINFSAGPIAVMLMRNLRRYDLPYVDAQLAIDDMMNGIFLSVEIPRRLTVMDILQNKLLR